MYYIVIRKASDFFYIWKLGVEGEEIPKSSMPTDIKVSSNQFVQLIEVYMPPIRDKMENRTEKKNITKVERD